MKRSVLIGIFGFFLFVRLGAEPLEAKQFLVLGAPLNLFGFASQTAQFSLKGDHFDTEEGLQQALFTLFAEADYSPSRHLTLYASGILTMDLVYPIKHDDRSWEDKGFADSEDDLFIDNKDWQALKEAHVTWSPGPFLFRVGKQIVSWGEMDFFRIVDQINPTDERRGFSDVEFETTIIPIWLVRAEWWPTLNLGAIQEAGLQLVFNPNAEFIPNQSYTTGNDVAGIWAPAYVYDNPVYSLLADLVNSPLGPLVQSLYGTPTPKLYVGALRETLDKPEPFSAEGFEYGLRLSVRAWDHLFTVCGFYGRENSPSNLAEGFVEHPLSEWTKPLLGEALPLLGTASDGTNIIYPIYRGYYPRQKFVGATWTKDLPLRSSVLGGVKPLARLEVLYQFDKTFVDSDETRYIRSDYLASGLGFDWKIKIPPLNRRAYFTVMPQFLFSRIMDYPDGISLSDLPDKNYYIFTLLLSTTYFNAKLAPELAMAFDINYQGQLILPGVSYQYSDRWEYKLEMAFLGGQKENSNLWLFRKKDYIAVKVKYKWG